MKVCIYDEGYIPGLGKGPFLTPVDITQDMYGLYKRMNLKIISAEPKPSIFETGVVNRVKTEKNPYIKEEVKETPFEITTKETKEVVKEVEISQDEETVENIPTEEEVIEEKTVEENDDVEEIAEETENDEEAIEEINPDELTKAQIVEILTDMGVECNKSMNKATLVKLLEENS